jgi:energy-coupling factor transport system permease protein
MNQFEFLRNVPVGQYLPIDSTFHRLDPRVRLLMFAMFLLALTLTASLIGLLIGLVVVLAGLRFGKIPYRYALRGLSGPLPFLAVLVVLQVFFNGGDPGSPVLLRLGPIWIVPIVEITQSDLLAGLRLLLRFFALIVGLGLMSFTLSTSEMTYGLNALLAPLVRLKLPAQDLATMIQVTLRFLPLLAQSVERIAKAQASRGADWSARQGNLIARTRRIIPLIVPLFLSSLRKAENMALAMDARAYGSKEKRSSYYEFHSRPLDGIFFFCVLALSVLILWI